MTFQEFYETRRNDPENQGRSFTLGACLYDYMKQGFEYEEAEYLIQEHVAQQLGIDLETVKDLPYRAVIEIPDISVYDDIARVLYGYKE